MFMRGGLESRDGTARRNEKNIRPGIVNIGANILKRIVLFSFPSGRAGCCCTANRIVELSVDRESPRLANSLGQLNVFFLILFFGMIFLFSFYC